MTTDKLIIETLRHDAKATAGPWLHVSSDNVICTDNGLLMWQARSRNCSVSERDANAEFIAHARTDLPALVSEVERLRKVEAAAEAPPTMRTRTRMAAGS